MNKDLVRIQAEIDRLKAEQRHARKQMAHCQRLGMYPEVASEHWTTRKTKGKYLYMLFPRARAQGKHWKEYVGCQPSAIQAAQLRNHWRKVYDTQEKRAYHAAIRQAKIEQLAQDLLGTARAWH